MLIGERVVDFLLVLIELFLLGITAEELRANIGWKSAISLQLGPVDPKFQVEEVTPTINHSSSQKTRLNVLSYYIKIWTDLSSILSQITRLTDGRTDGRTDRQNYHRCIACSAVKIRQQWWWWFLMDFYLCKNFVNNFSWLKHVRELF